MKHVDNTWPYICAYTEPAVADWMFTAVGIGIPLVVCLFLGLLVIGGLFYHYKRPKLRLSSRPVKFANSNGVLAYPVNALMEESLRQRTVSVHV